MTPSCQSKCWSRWYWRHAMDNAFLNLFDCWYTGRNYQQSLYQTPCSAPHVLYPSMYNSFVLEPSVNLFTKRRYRCIWVRKTLHLDAQHSNGDNSIHAPQIFQIQLQLSIFALVKPRATPMECFRSTLTLLLGACDAFRLIVCLNCSFPATYLRGLDAVLSCCRLHIVFYFKRFLNNFNFVSDENKPPHRSLFLLSLVIEIFNTWLFLLFLISKKNASLFLHTIHLNDWLKKIKLFLFFGLFYLASVPP